MKGWFIRNYYYNDSGTDYIFERLRECFKKLNISLEEKREVLSYNFFGNNNFVSLPDFVIFWDKDIKLCRALERKGVRVFNSSSAIENCDDKERTYAAIAGLEIEMPKTVCAPLAYKGAIIGGGNFLKILMEHIAFPMVAKENCGSQGKQVYLINNEADLTLFYEKMFAVPHHYQHFYESSRGRDYRLYVIGGEVAAICERENTTDFKANVCLGGTMKMISPPNLERLIMRAKLISKKLALDYGSIDFLALDDKEVFLEANSNAYFKTIELLGANIAERYCEHIKKSLRGKID